MQINRHGSFYIRNGWPTKIIDAISDNKAKTASEIDRNKTVRETKQNFWGGTTTTSIDKDGNGTSVREFNYDNGGFKRTTSRSDGSILKESAKVKVDSETGNTTTTKKGSRISSVR